MTTLNFRTVTVPYVNATNQLQKKPVFYVKFGAVVGPLGITNPALQEEYASGPILNATKARKRLLYNPGARSNQIDPLRCHTTFSSMQITLIDLNGEISKLVSNYTMKNRMVTLYAGYQNISESDFMPFTAQIDNWMKTSDGTGYIFFLVGPLKNFLKNILSGHTRLSQKYNVGDSIMFVTSLDNRFAGSTDLQDGQGARNFIKVGDCVYSYLGRGNEILDGTVLWMTAPAPTGVAGQINKWKTSTAYTVGQTVYTGTAGNAKFFTCVRAGTSASSGTGPVGPGVPMFFGVKFIQPMGTGSLQDANHDSGETVDNYVLYQGNPVTLMLQIMLSTGVGTNWSGTGTNYDVLPYGQGIGIPYSLVNITHIEEQRDVFLRSVVVQQFFHEESQGIKFFEDHLCQTLCFWLFENRQGQADVTFFYVPMGTLDAVTINDSLIIGSPQYDANLQTGAEFVNQSTVYYDFQPTSGSDDSYISLISIFDSNSQTKYREASSLEIKAKFFKTIFGGGRLAFRSASMFINLYKDPPPKINCKMLYSTHLINVGDVVNVGSKFFPDPKSAFGAATPQYAICVMLTPNFNNGSVDGTFLGFGFNATGRSAGIAPDGTPDYASATDQQKQVYAFISDDTTGLMPNGDPPYLITP